MNKRCSLLVCVVALWVFSTQYVSAQMVAVRSDVLKDLLMTPNIGLDFVIGDRHTIGAEVAFNTDPWGAQMKMTSVTPEYRYWFNGRPFTRQYVGAVAILTNYDLVWNNIYSGDALGAGVSFGHVWTLNERCNIDLTASVGVIGYKQKFYYKNDYFADYGERTNAMGYLLLPIRLGVSVVYVLR